MKMQSKTHHRKALHLTPLPIVKQLLSSHSFIKPTEWLFLNSMVLAWNIFCRIKVKLDITSVDLKPLKCFTDKLILV